MCRRLWASPLIRVARRVTRTCWVRCVPKLTGDGLLRTIREYSDLYRVLMDLIAGLEMLNAVLLVGPYLETNIPEAAARFVCVGSV